MSDKAMQLLTAWDWQPSIILGCALLVAVYVGAQGPLRPVFGSNEQVSRWQAFWFLLGVGLIFFALVSPLDAMGDGYSFSAHMLQHMLLMVVAPPLLLLGTPGWMLRPLLAHRPLLRLAQVLTAAPIAFLLFNVDLFVWHLPACYEATLQNPGIHIVEHLSFIALGVINWWPLLSPLPELPRLPYSRRILYLLLDSIPSIVLGWLFVSASTVAYPTYAAAPQVFGIDALTDQWLGGLMMTMPVGLIFLGALRASTDEPAGREAEPVLS